MPYSFAAFEHLADVGRAPSPAAGAPAGLLPHATTLLSARPAGPGAPRRPGACPTNGLRLSSLSKTIWHCAKACATLSRLPPASSGASQVHGDLSRQARVV